MCSRRWLPDGRHQPGSAPLAGQFEARQADPLLGRQPHLDRRTDRLARHEDEASASMRAAGTRSASTARHRRDRRRDPQGAEPTTAVADRLPHDHRLRLAEQGRHGRGAWLAARQGRDRRHARAFGWTSPPFVVPAEWSRPGTRRAARRGRFRRVARALRQIRQARRVRDAAIGQDAEAVRNALIAMRTKFASEKPKIATRQASGNVLDALAPQIPSLIGGSADLTARPTPRRRARPSSRATISPAATSVTAFASTAWPPR